MRRGMVFADRAATRAIDLERHCETRLYRACFDDTDMRVEITGVFLRVRDFETDAVGRHDASVADLATGFTVERRLIEDDRAAFALFQRANFLAVAQHGGYHAFGA